MVDHPAPPRDTHGRFVKATPDAPAMHVSGVPGAQGCDPFTEPVNAGGCTWTAADCGPLASPIGAALALETAGAFS